MAVVLKTTSVGQVAVLGMICNRSCVPLKPPETDDRNREDHPWRSFRTDCPNTATSVTSVETVRFVTDTPSPPPSQHV